MSRQYNQDNITMVQMTFEAILVLVKAAPRTFADVSEEDAETALRVLTRVRKSMSEAMQEGSGQTRHD